jgi:hypothetical protein
MLCFVFLVGASIDDAFGRHYVGGVAVSLPSSTQPLGEILAPVGEGGGGAPTTLPWRRHRLGAVADGKALWRRGWSQSTADLGLSSSFVSGRDVVMVFFLHWIHVGAGSCGAWEAVWRAAVLYGVSQKPWCHSSKPVAHMCRGRRLAASDLSNTPPMKMVSWRCVVLAMRFR